MRYQDGEIAVVEDDRSGDGKVDLRAEFNPDGSKRREQQDTSGDGTFDVLIVYKQGRKVLLEEDPDQDGFAEVVTSYEDEVIVRREAASKASRIAMRARPMRA